MSYGLMLDEFRQSSVFKLQTLNRLVSCFSSPQSGSRDLSQRCRTVILGARPEISSKEGELELVSD